MHEKTKKVLEKSKKLKRTLTGKPLETVEISDHGKNVHQNHSNTNSSPNHHFDPTQLKM